jgi:hypothetical protein
MITEKGKAIAKWIPSEEFMSEYDRIFRKKDRPISDTEDAYQGEVDLVVEEQLK